MSMQKVRCPHCGVVNMEGFVTFPFCAGCGSSLPQIEKLQSNTWQRPVRATMLAAVIGVSVLALFVVGMSYLEVRESPQDNLQVFGSAPASVRINNDFIVRLTVTREDTPDSSSLMFRDVAVRFPNDIENEFHIRQLDPAPAQRFERERGIYYFYPKLSSPYVTIRLQARRAGTHKVDVRLYMDEALKGRYEKSVEVVPLRNFSLPEK
jgi:hypothetical protein